MQQYPPPHHYPPPQDPNRFPGKITVGTAVALVAFSVLGVVMRVVSARSRETKAAKQASLPAVSSEGTLAHAPPDAALCRAERFNFGWPCGSGSATRVAPSSHVRVMKAGVERGDALCRYWVQGGPNDNASGDAPCEWFVAQ